MRIVKLLVAGAAIGMIAAAFRDWETGGWLQPAGLTTEPEVDEEEPVLGYDGMDQETLIDWLSEAELDPDTLERVRLYELAHRNRGPVLAAVDDLIG